MASIWSPGSHGWLLRIFTLSFCPALGLGFLRYDQTDTWWAFQPWYCFWIKCPDVHLLVFWRFYKVTVKNDAAAEQLQETIYWFQVNTLPGWKIILMVFKLSFASEMGDWGFSSGRSILCEESWKETLFQLMFMGLMFLVCYPAVRAHEIQLQSTSLPELWGISQILNENSAIVIGLILLVNFHTHSLAVLKCKLQTMTFHVMSLVWWHVFSPLTSTYWFPWDVSEISRLLPFR